MAFYTTLIERLEAEQRELLRHAQDPAIEKVRQLNLLKGIGTNSAWLYVMELFGWRELRNRREVGAIVGLAPTPHESGQQERERGMSKAGNRHVRTMAIEIAWGWLRFQPKSELSKWYQRRFGNGSTRIRKIGIVALARKLSGAGCRSSCGLVEGDKILAPWSVEEDHPGTAPETLLHPKDGLVEAERAVEITDDKMDMREALGLDHRISPPFSAPPHGSALSCVAQAADGR